MAQGGQKFDYPNNFKSFHEVKMNYRLCLLSVRSNQQAQMNTILYYFQYSLTGMFYIRKVLISLKKNFLAMQLDYEDLLSSYEL
jgi:hypothetical protein